MCQRCVRAKSKTHITQGTQKKKMRTPEKTRLYFFTFLRKCLHCGPRDGN